MLSLQNISKQHRKAGIATGNDLDAVIEKVTIESMIEYA